MDFHAEQTTPQASHVGLASAGSARRRRGERGRFGDLSNGFDFSTEIKKSSDASFSVFGGVFAGGGVTRGGGLVGVVGARVVRVTVDSAATARGKVVAAATNLGGRWRKV